MDKPPMHTPTAAPECQSIATQIAVLSDMHQLLSFFDIAAEPVFVERNAMALYKRFNGNCLQHKPADWFDYRRCLKRAYCLLQRRQMKAEARHACHGCLSCDRR